MRNYRKYEVWQIGHDLTKKIYLLTAKLPKVEVYGLTSQIRRATVSIPTNIAEGCGRFTDKEFGRFVDISIGSTNETEYLLFLSSELNFISGDELEPIAIQLNLLRQKLIQLRKKLLE